MGDVLFRVDAGKVWGLSFGHAYRCLALAEELARSHGLSCSFVMKDIPNGIEVVRRRGFPVEPLAANAPPERETAAILARRETTVVVDLPAPNPAAIDAAARAGKAVVVFDARGAAYPAALVVDGGIGVPAAQKDGRRLAGPAYCVLGFAFDGRRRATTRAPGRRALVTFGGSDPAGLTPRMVRALARRVRVHEIIVILGPGYVDDGALARLATESNGTITLTRDVADVAGAMLDCDAAVSAAGLTAYELAATGTPAVLVPSIEHERPVARALAQAGTAVAAEVANDRDAETAADALLALLDDPARRETMRRVGLALVDGLGRRRVADAIAALGVAGDVRVASGQQTTS